MKIKTLSTIPGLPFNDILETFFDTYEVDEEIECYQFIASPYGPETGTSFDDLNKIKFQSRVVIFNVIDTFVDKTDNVAVDELIKFCKSHPEQKFIISTCHLNFQKEVKAPNLYLDSYMPTCLSENFIHCEKKDLTNKWVSLNADTKVHRVLTVSYLLSKDYHRNGLITFNMDVPTLAKYDQYRNITTPSQELKSDLSKGFTKFKNKEFNLLKIPRFDPNDSRLVHNYNTNLIPVYQRVGVEIITGTTFFEKTPIFTEKEMQTICGKNFPIFLNGVGIAKEIKNFFGVDIFEDIVDHSYDDIEDHFERLAAAIDRNQHLLDGSTNIKELWYDNRKRFDDNCKQMDLMLHAGEYQQTFNHERIKRGLLHFKVSFVKK